MTSLLHQQRKLLDEKLQVLQRLEHGLQWSLERLPEINAGNIDDPAISERISAIVDRFCKFQDQLAGALGHAHAMLGEKHRSFHDVVTWAVAEKILTDETVWLEICSLRNRLTHEYDLASDQLPELMTLVRQSKDVLTETTRRFMDLCKQRDLTSR